MRNVNVNGILPEKVIKKLKNYMVIPQDDGLMDFWIS